MNPCSRPTAESAATVATNLFNQEFMANTPKRRTFAASLQLAELDAYHRLRSLVAADPGNIFKRDRLRRFVRSKTVGEPRERVSWKRRTAWREAFLRDLESGGQTVRQALRECEATPNQYANAMKLPAFRRRLDAAIARMEGEDK